jgi:hypothetical protein
MRWLYIVLAALIGVADIWADAGSWNWILSGYAWDVALPILTYFFVQQVFDAEGGWWLALLVLVIHCAGEVAQLFLKGQTFDPWDFLAYGTGVVLALLLDRITPRRQAAETTHSAGSLDE